MLDLPLPRRPLALVLSMLASNTSLQFYNKSTKPEWVGISFLGSGWCINVLLLCERYLKLMGLQQYNPKEISYMV